eukprot:354060-Chlamydomonas_euryale.AAC.4
MASAPGMLLLQRLQKVRGAMHAFQAAVSVDTKRTPAGSQSYRERTQLGMSVRNKATNQRLSARAAHKNGEQAGGRPPAKPYQTPLHDPPSCHPTFLPPLSIHNRIPTDLQTTMNVTNWCN